MKPQRRNRLLTIGFLLVGVAVAVGLVLAALRENIDLFYPPEKIVAGDAPVDRRIRAGGMVAAGSVQRGDDLAVSFKVTDHAGSEFLVHYEGILPDLFREGQGVLATGVLQANGEFVAEQILAKHDENYMPPELAGIGAPDGPAEPAPNRSQPLPDASL